MRAVRFAAGLWLGGLFAAGLSAAAKPGCGAVSFPDLPLCIEGAHGIILGSNDAAADLEDARLGAEDGAALWQRHFGAEPPAYAVVLGDLTGAVIETLNDAGFAAVLPWRPSAQLLAAAEPQIRAAVEKQMPGIDAARKQEVIAKALEQLRQQIGGRAIVPHELGHLWLVQSYWAGAREAQAYGGPAADWLDECAAVLMENDAMTAGRRQAFAEAWRKGEAPPLLVFVYQEHPMLAAARAATSAGPESDGGRVELKMGGDAQGSIGGVFYGQARVFADFLIAASGNERILAVIAAGAQKGLDFEDWLKTEGRAHGLPRSMAALQKQFDAYATQTFGAPG